LIKLLLGYELPGLSFSSGGEDVLLNYLFGFKNQGFFVDVGAYHPVAASNTYLFYLKGWRGINIDARPGSMSAFQAQRPDDINLELAVADTDEELTYYSMNDGHSSMNTCSAEFVQYLNIAGDVTGEVKLRPVPLARVLDEHLPPGRGIDFLTVDVEGMEASVLRSNDWLKYRPRVIMLESFARLSAELFSDAAAQLLITQGYRPIVKTTSEIVFLDGPYDLSPVGQIVL
jgi:FkbM family methyltransferase